MQLVCSFRGKGNLRMRAHVRNSLHRAHSLPSVIISEISAKRSISTLPLRCFWQCNRNLFRWHATAPRPKTVPVKNRMSDFLSNETFPNYLESLLDSWLFGSLSVIVKRTKNTSKKNDHIEAKHINGGQTLCICRFEFCAVPSWNLISL